MVDNNGDVFTRTIGGSDTGWMNAKAASSAMIGHTYRITMVDTSGIVGYSQGDSTLPGYDICSALWPAT
jgi:hypothetical protein